MVAAVTVALMNIGDQYLELRVPIWLIPIGRVQSPPHEPFARGVMKEGAAVTVEFGKFGTKWP